MGTSTERLFQELIDRYYPDGMLPPVRRLTARLTGSNEDRWRPRHEVDGTTNHDPGDEDRIER